MVDIKKIGSGYLAQVPLNEIKEMYGNVHEYIKQQHGPGDYQLTVQKGKNTSSRRIKVAGELGDIDPPQLQMPQSGGVNDPAAITMLLQLQQENAQLKAQIDVNKETNRAAMWEQIMQIGSPLIQGLITKKEGTGEEAAGMLRNTIESIKDLMDISQSIPQLGGAGGGGDDSGLGSIMNAITGFVQMQQAKQQQSPQVPPGPKAQPNFAQPTPPIMPEPPSQPQPPTPDPSQEGKLQVDPFDEVISMVEQRKDPKEVATHLMSNLSSLDEAAVDPSFAPILRQMRNDPLLAWDSLCQMLPSLKEGDYAQNVRTVIENTL